MHNSKVLQEVWTNPWTIWTCNLQKTFKNTFIATVPNFWTRITQSNVANEHLSPRQDMRINFCYFDSSSRQAKWSVLILSTLFIYAKMASLRAIVYSVCLMWGVSWLVDHNHFYLRGKGPFPCAAPSRFTHEISWRYFSSITLHYLTLPLRLAKMGTWRSEVHPHTLSRR
jgi:hypothetical protein